MMYIKESSCISPQQTYENNSFDEKILLPENNYFKALEPSYLDLIPRGLLRRMNKATRMSIACALPLLEKHKTDAIILGSCESGSSSDEFLEQIIEFNEGTLTPTNFVQSTSNSIAGILALMNKNFNYNITHVNAGLAFEAALLDAFLFLEEQPNSKLLLGSSNEPSKYNINIKYHILKDRRQFESKNEFPLEMKLGEGAAFFIVDNNPINALAKITDVEQILFPDQNKIKLHLEKFLERNNLKMSDIDGIVLGKFGDNYTDFWYDNFVNEFHTVQNLYSYKNVVGDYGTSTSFATWLSIQILQNKLIPDSCIIEKKNDKVEKILIYNHYEEKQHSFILLFK